MLRIPYFNEFRGAGNAQSNCRWAIIASIFLLASAPLKAAENEVELLWRQQNEAITALEQSAAQTAKSQEALAQIYADMAVATQRLEENDSAYFAVLDRYYATLAAIEEQHKQRLLAKVLPEFLTAKRNALQKQWDFWLDYPTSRTLPFSEVTHLIRNDLSAANKEISKAVAEGNRKIANTIDPEIRRLEAVRDSLFVELANLAKVGFDTELTIKWFNAAQDLHESQQQQTANTKILDSSYAAFVASLADASPPFLQGVKVTAGDQVYYDFAWIRDGYEDDVTASVEYSRQRDQIADILPNYSRILKTITNERDLTNGDRHILALKMRGVSAELVGFGDEHYLLERNQILANALAEMGIAVAETLLTGGIATATRRAEVEIERRLAAAANNIEVFGVAEEFVEARINSRLRRAISQTSQQQYTVLTETLNWQRATFVAAEIENAVLNKLRLEGLRFDTIAEASQELLPAKVNRLVREVSSEVESRASKLFPSMVSDSFTKEAAAVAERNLFSGEGVSEVLGSSATSAAGKSLDIYGAYAERQQRALVHNPQTTDLGEIFQGQAIEWAIGTGIDAAPEIRNLLAGAPDAVGLKSLGRQAVIGAAFSTIEGSVKAFINTHYEGKISEAEAGYWAAYSQLAAMQQYFYYLTLEDGDAANTENWYRDVVNKMNAYLSEIGLPRRAGGKMPEPLAIPSDFEVATVEFNFSTPLTAAPFVRIGSTELQVVGQGRHWQTTIEISPAHRNEGTAQLSVELGQGNQAYSDLDRKPSTIAYIPYDKLDWVGYDRGTDTRHSIKFDENPSDAPTTGGCGADKFWGPELYNSSSFKTLSAADFDWEFLENFNTGSVSSKGVGSAGRSGSSFGQDLIDSVDGDSWWGGGSLDFAFSKDQLGSLPTHVGVVWTDGGGPTQLEAWGACGYLGTTGLHDGFSDGTIYGGKEEDRFFGVIAAEGITNVRISNSPGGIEVDNLHYASVSTFSGQILSANYPQTIVANGAKEEVQLLVSGKFALPVTTVLKPKSCPDGISCGTETRVIEELGDNDILYMADVLWCRGSSEDWTLSYEAYFEDANGNKSNAVSVVTLCKNAQ